METSDALYREHAVFSDLMRYAGFYRNYADGVFQFASMGTTAICNMDTYVFKAIGGTLDYVRSVLQAGQINDAYSLLRKYHDSIVINIYSNLYLRDRSRSPCTGRGSRSAFRVGTLDARKHHRSPSERLASWQKSSSRVSCDVSVHS